MLWLTVFSLLAVACSPIDGDGNEVEPFAVYTQVLVEGLGYTSAEQGALLRDLALTDDEMQDTVPELDELRPDLSLDETALSDLLSRSGERFRFDAPARFDTPAAVTLAAEAEVPPFGAPAEDWERFWEAHDGSSHVLLFSQIGVGEHQLLVYVVSVCGDLCGGAYVFAFEADEGGWTLVTNERVANL